MRNKDNKKGFNGKEYSARRGMAKGWDLGESRVRGLVESVEKTFILKVLRQNFNKLNN